MQGIPNMYGTKKMRVLKLVLQPTGTYNDQFRRPYQTELDQSSYQHILDQVGQARAISPQALSQVAGLFVHPSATPEAQIQVANGWGTQRMRFLLVVESQDRTGLMNVTQYIQGWTDYVGQSYGGALDPNMVFFVNSVNTTRNSLVQTAFGSQQHQTIVDSSLILVNDQYRPGMGSSGMYGMRPEDIYDQIDSNQLSGEVESGFILDGRSTINGSATKSKRANSVAPIFMSEVLDSYLQTNNARSDDTQTNIMDSARRTVESGAISSDPFMSFVRENSPMQGGNSFTFSHLCMLDPNTPQIVETPEMTMQMQSSLHVAGSTQFWHGSTYDSLWATTIAQSMPSYMQAFGLNKVRVRSTNEGVGGIPVSQIVMHQSYSNNQDMTRQLQAFIYRFENELIRSLTQNNIMSYRMDVMCDLLGDTAIEVSINGAAEVPYVAPSFMDAMLAPVTTFEKQRLAGAANDFNQLMQGIVENNNTLSGMGPASSMATGLI